MVDVTAESIGQLRDLRASSPGSIADLLLKRKRRPLLGADGRLFIVAADHPARGSLGVRDNAMAMASRIDLLRRLVVALDRPGVDGVLGTPDIIEDLALLGALDDKVVVGSMNRGGLRGSTFEIDDRFTGYNVKTIVDGGLDFAKLLVRIDLQDHATANTLEHTARAVTESAENRVPIMLEPFMSRRSDGLVVNDLSTEAVITSIAIASGLGASSAYSWLKVPVVDDMERVIEASTLPTLLLGGDSDTSSDETFASWQNALTLPGVRGLVVGRSLLYPADDDVALAVDTAAGLVHERVRAL
jgi:DhnA family fructose-bisphosphate aldolase class Ia